MFPVSHLEVENGLSNTKINTIYKDRTGFLWLGTTSGLFRYDGYSVKSFLKEDPKKYSIFNNYIEDIQEDAEGKLWILADSKWRILDPETGDVVPDVENYLRNKIPEGNLSTINIDNEKNVWIAFQDRGLYCLDRDKRKTRHFSNTYFDHKKVTDIIPYNGRVILISDDGEVAFVDPVKKTLYKVPSERGKTGNEGNRFIYQGYVDKEKRLWIYSNEDLRLFNLNKNRWETGKLPDGGRVGVVKYIYNDRKGRLWIARDHHGLEKVERTPEGYGFNSVESQGGPTSNNTITCIFEDGGGTLWFGTYKQGLFSHNETITKFGIEGIPDVNCIIPADGNGLWIGTDNTGLWKWNPVDGSKIRYSDAGDEDGDVAITSIAKGKDGILYIGSFSRGVMTFDDGKFSRLKTGTALDENYPWALVTDGDCLWTGTLGGGLYRTNLNTGETLVFTTANSKLASDYILSAIRSRDGKLYFGTSTGMSVYDPATGEINSYLTSEEENGSGMQNINQIYEDSRGLLWLATRNGLKVIDRQRRKLHSVRLRDNAAEFSFSV